MILIVHRLNAVSSEMIHRIRAAEERITLAERLRWNGELVVSDGRGFLISGHADLLQELERATASFDRALDALKNNPLNREGAALVRNIEKHAHAFRSVQEKLVLDRERSKDVTAVVRRFEGELVPLRKAFGDSLDRLVRAKVAEIDSVYRDAQKGRERLKAWLYALAAALLIVGLALSWLFVRALAAAFKKEHDALDKARTALGARDMVLGVVAHDLRTPLGAIMMKADRIAKTAESESVRQRGASIVSVATRMEHLIKSMLDIATLEAGSFTVQATNCKVEDLLHGVIEVFGGLAAAKRVTLEQCVEAPNLAVRADRERVLQVLSNLIGNAIKFTPPNGKIKIAVHQLNKEVRFSIADTGPGIAREHLALVFDRFWKHDMPGKKGTGLGLFIAKGIVSAHGGRMWADSEPGHGATFHFTLPVAITEPLMAQA
jgi:signal transduction histidine kinase